MLLSRNIQITLSWLFVLVAWGCEPIVLVGGKHTLAIASLLGPRLPLGQV